MQSIKNESTSDITKILWRPKNNKITQHQMQIRKCLHRFPGHQGARITYRCPGVRSLGPGQPRVVLWVDSKVLLARILH